jgi:hypothetical protein
MSTDLGLLLQAASHAASADRQARLDDEKEAFAARLQASTKRAATYLVHHVSRDLATDMLAWIESTGARVGLTMATHHAELHVSLVARAAPVQYLNPDTAGATGDAPSVGG